MKSLKILFLIFIVVNICSCSSSDTKLYGGNYRRGWSYSKNNLVAGKTVTVSKKDTVYAISRRYKVPVKDIIAINNLKPPILLKIGQKIIIPKARVHIVKKKDTLYSISRNYGVDLTSLARVNNLKQPYNITPGQTLILPGTVSQTRTANNRSRNFKKYNPISIDAPNKRSKYNFAWPIRGRILSDYGQKGKGIHNDGINIKGKLGEGVMASENGVVAYTGNELKGFGNLILIKHADGFMSAYAHTETVLVKRGEKVNRGEKIATVGSTGNVSVPQVHFEIRKESKALDPLKYLEK